MLINMQKQPGNVLNAGTVRPNLRHLYCPGGEAGSQGAPWSDPGTGGSPDSRTAPGIFLFLPQGTTDQSPKKHQGFSPFGETEFPEKAQRTGPGISYCFKSNIPFCRCREIAPGTLYEIKRVISGERLPVFRLRAWMAGTWTLGQTGLLLLKEGGGPALPDCTSGIGIRGAWASESSHTSRLIKLGAWIRERGQEQAGVTLGVGVEGEPQPCSSGPEGRGQA